jgi:hypothetical protein
MYYRKDSTMHALYRSLISTALLSACSLTQAATVTEVFNGEMLDTSQRYFESIAGVPRESYGDQHLFRVNGCNITATIQNNSVSALRMELTPSCPANLSSFIGDSFAPPAGQPLTIGSFQKAAGDMSFYADCLTMCGNASDPTLQAHWEGPHAVNFREVMLEVVLADDASLQASNQWQAQMTAAKGEDFIMATRFNCERTFDAQAQQSFAKVAINAVTIGSGLTKPGC